MLPFKFFMSYFYSFLAAIIAAVAINLLTTASLETEKLFIPHPMVYVSIVSLIVSALGFAIVGWGLEEAKTEWLLKKAPPNRELIQELIKDKFPCLWIGLVMGILGLGYFLVLIISKQWFPIG